MNEYFTIKDRCRRGLIKYLEVACKKIPKIINPDILDIGCGTGVPTLWLAETFSGNITAIDIDKNSIDYLQHKIKDKNLQDRIKTFCTAFFEFKCKSDFYDIILAEGFLNVVGFEAGFLKIREILKKGGYLIVHDEYKGHNKKLEFINENKCMLIDTIYLDENVWWNDYYRQLEIEIGKTKISKTGGLFKEDTEEIKCYKSNPSLFSSIYYIIVKAD